MLPARSNLAVQEDLPFQKRVWCVERVCWIFMLLFVMGGLIGVLGPGPLSKKVNWEPTSQLLAEYNRFDHYQSPTALKVEIASTSVSGHETPLVLNREFIENVELTHIDPAPERIESRADAYTFYFGTVSNQSATVVFHYEPNRFGKMPIQIKLGDGNPLYFEQVYFP